MPAMEISSEHLAYWFLRLNGFMTTYNFVVHPEQADGNGNFPQQTDVDVMGVRFPHRQENRRRPMADHQSFQADETIQLVLAETKSGHCQLNRAWREPHRENMQKVLSAAGVVPPGQLDVVAASLYDTGRWTNGVVSVRWVAFGGSHSRDLAHRFPAVPQFTWVEDVLPFIYTRFCDYKAEKRMHGQWNTDGRGLFYTAIYAESCDAFVQEVQVVNP